MREEFLASTPAASVVEVKPLDSGDRTAVYLISYRLAADTVIRAQQWFYERGADGKWALLHRDTTGTTGWLRPAWSN